MYWVTHHIISLPDTAQYLTSFNFRSRNKRRSQSHCHFICSPNNFDDKLFVRRSGVK